MKKIHALIPSEREKTCLHEHAPHCGSMPKTGPFCCTMCGTKFDSVEDLRIARVRAEITERFACCGNAEMVRCNCMYSFQCPDHGQRCVGSHD